MAATSTGTVRRTLRSALAARLGLGCAALLLAGCSGEADPGQEASPADTTGLDAGEAETGVGSAMAFASPDADDFNRRLAPEDGLADLQPVLILSVVTGGAAGVVVSFEMESHHCHGIQVRVEETAAEVVLDLQTGRRAGVSPAACAYGVYPYTTALELGRPLGARAIATATDRPGAAAPDGGSGAGHGTDAAAGEADRRLDPAQVDPVDVAPGQVGRYLGRPVEDGVEWALANDRSWRVLSLDGEPVDDADPEDPERLSLTVVADVIVAYEWS